MPAIVGGFVGAGVRSASLIPGRKHRATSPLEQHETRIFFPQTDRSAGVGGFGKLPEASVWFDFFLRHFQVFYRQWIQLNSLWKDRNKNGSANVRKVISKQLNVQTVAQNCACHAGFLILVKSDQDGLSLDGYFGPFSLLVVSLWRPLARRRLSTSFPLLDLERLRNPCLFFRFRLLGW